LYVCMYVYIVCMCECAQCRFLRLSISVVTCYEGYEQRISCLLEQATCVLTCLCLLSSSRSQEALPGSVEEVQRQHTDSHSVKADSHTGKVSDIRTPALSDGRPRDPVGAEREEVANQNYV
jgi:hypothetical protein